VPLPGYLAQKVRCPSCAKVDANVIGPMAFEHGCWLACQGCGRKYPVVDMIPNLTIQEGDKWIGIPSADLPVPPPSAGAAG
jgi:uncharacterized protein YbaR (Trm112 family)